MKHILIAYEESPVSDHVLERTAELAKHSAHASPSRASHRYSSERDTGSGRTTPQTLLSVMREKSTMRSPASGSSASTERLLRRSSATPST